ncbi:MAG: 50S ribosomal protein L4 [Alphaproteobacteria bacterium]
MKLKVLDLDSKDAGEIELADAVFGVPVRRDLLARMVNWQLAKRRAGTHKVKEVGEISGTGKRPWRQKGTGRARQGSTRAAQWRGGQTTFGPHPRSYEHDLTKKVRKAALRAALSAKAADGKLVVLEAASASEPRTKAMAERLGRFGFASALIIDGAELDRNFTLAVRNIPGVDLLPQQGANVYDILRRDTLVLTRAAVASLEERLK